MINIIALYLIIKVKKKKKKSIEVCGIIVNIDYWELADDIDY